jgi:YHS domain-containing protein
MNHMAALPGNVRIAALLILVFVCAPAFSADQSINANEDGIAIHGYDPVAYFVDGKTVRGEDDLDYEWSGVTWLFASEHNRQLFIEKPQAYAPQYGGFCAYAASYGQFADIDPQAWSIVNGKLYLNYSPRVRKTWRPRAAEFIRDADQLWPTMEKNPEGPER